MLKSLTPERSGAVFGIMAGAICVLYLFILYLISIKIFASLWTYIGYIVIVFFKIVAVEMARRAQNNIIYFKDALKTAFLVSVVSLFMWVAFQHAIYSSNPAVAEAAKQNRIEFVEWSMKLSKAPDEVIQEAIENTKMENFGASLKNDFLAYGFFMIIGFFYALLIAGIFHLMSKGYAAQHPLPQQDNPNAR